MLCLAKLLTKVSRSENFDEDDWFDVVTLTSAGVSLLYAHCNIDRTNDHENSLTTRPSSKKNKTKK